MDIMEKLLPDFLKGRSFQRLSPCCHPPIHAHARHRLADSALRDPLQGRHGRLRHHKEDFTCAFPPKRQWHSIPIHSLFSSIGSSSHSNFVLHHLKFKLFSRGPFLRGVTAISGSLTIHAETKPKAVEMRREQPVSLQVLLILSFHFRFL